jgi:hypothetical protein
VAAAVVLVEVLDGQHANPSAACAVMLRRAATRMNILPSPSRFRAKRPVTFSVLAKKVTRESRARESAACGGALCCSATSRA